MSRWSLPPTPQSYRSRFLWLDRERGRSSCTGRRTPAPKSSRRRSGAFCAAPGSCSDTNPRSANKGDFIVRDRDRPGADLQSRRGRQGQRLLQHLPPSRRGDLPRAAWKPQALRLPLPRLGIQELGRAVRSACQLRLRRPLQRGWLLRPAARATDRAARGLLLRQLRPRRDSARRVSCRCGADARRHRRPVRRRHGSRPRLPRVRDQGELQADLREQLRRLSPRPDALELRRLHAHDGARHPGLGDEHPWRRAQPRQRARVLRARDPDRPARRAVAARLGRGGEGRDRGQEEGARSASWQGAGPTGSR